MFPPAAETFYRPRAELSSELVRSVIKRELPYEPAQLFRASLGGRFIARFR